MATAAATNRRSAVGGDEGQSLVFFALLITVFFLLMLVVIDGTHAFDTRRNLQTAADAAALAAAWDIGNGADDTTVATTALRYSNLNNGPDLHIAKMQHCDGVLLSCYTWPYLGDDDRIEVQLNIPCVHSFFGGIANAFTKTTSFDCVAESAHAIAVVTKRGPPAPYKFVSLLTDGEDHTLAVRSGAKLTTDNGIYVNACFGGNESAGSCPSARSTDCPTPFTGAERDGAACGLAISGGAGAVSAPELTTAGGWDKGAGGVKVGGNDCVLTNPAPTDTPSTASGCPLVGQAAMADPYQALPGPALGSPAHDSCPLCAEEPITKIERSSGITKVWLDPANWPTGGINVGQQIALTDVAVSGASAADSASFDWPQYTVQASNAVQHSVTLTDTRFPKPADYPPPVPVPVKNWSLGQGKATLTTKVQHNISGGDTIAVSGVNPALDDPSPGADWTADPATDPSSTSVSYPDPALTTYTVSGVALSTSADGTTHTATVTVQSAPAQDVGVDTITVDVGEPAYGEPAKNSTHLIAGQNVASKSFTYTTPAKIAVSGAAVTGSTTNGCGGAAGCATISIPDNGLQPNDVVHVSTPDAPYGGDVTVLGSTQGPSGSFSWLPPDLSFDRYSVAPDPSSGITTATLTTSGTIDPGVTRVRMDTFPQTYLKPSAGMATNVEVSADRHSIMYPIAAHANVALTAGTSTAQVRQASSTPAWDVTAITEQQHAPIGGATTATAQTYIAGGSCSATCGSVIDTSGAGVGVDGGTLTLVFPNSRFAPALPFHVATDTTLNPGTYYGGICIGIATGSCDASSCDASYVEQPFTGSPTLALPLIGSSTVQFDVKSSTSIQTGDVIRIDNEWMQVDNASIDAAHNRETLTVARGFNGSTIQDHLDTGAVIFHEAPKPGGAHVTLNDGIYVIGGGGFYVCGSASLSAPSVLIYNTDDAANQGFIGRVEIDTSGAVDLGPTTLAPYNGMTIFQDRNDVNDTGVSPVVDASHDFPSGVELDPGKPEMEPGDTQFSYVGGHELQPGDVIQVDSELMLVTDLLSPTAVQVVRGFLGTSQSTHTPSTQIHYVSFSGDTCSQKSQDPSRWDVALNAMKSTGPATVTGSAGALGSISGTVYLPGPRAELGIQAGGTANLAVYSSCITIDGANAAFQINPETTLATVGTALAG